jgi:hypothetical protein
MLSFSGSVKVLVALEPCDLCKGFNGLPGSTETANFRRQRKKPTHAGLDD